MKMPLTIIIILTLLVACQTSNDEQKTSSTKRTLDSLSLQKEEKKSEAEKLNSELDSLRRLRDSLDAITTGDNS